jgi:deoxyribose-phosphate aldolase
MTKPDKLNRYFDHTVLKPETQQKTIENLCKEAGQYRFFSVCVNPAWVSFCRNYFEINKIKDVAVCTVIGFPLGANSTRVKLFEIEQAIIEGADELDVVINVGKLKDGDKDYILNELSLCKKLAGERVVKVIIETTLCDESEKKLATELVMKSGCDFVKTSTGFAGGGATVADIKLIKKIVKNNTKIKASGGIKTYQFVLELIEAGADRIGASSTVAIMNESK